MDKGKITMRQAYKLAICLSFSPAVRIVPIYETLFAGQAGWLAPIVAFFPVFILLRIFTKMFSVYKEESYSQAICDILGDFIGKFILFVYLIGISILLASYIRYYAIRVNLSLTPTSKIHVEVISMLLLVYLLLRYGLVLLSRAGEIILASIIIGFIVFFILSINNIELIHLIPISYKDIIPIGKASYGIAGIWSYFTFMYFYSDKITGKDEMGNVGLKYLLFFTVINFMLGIMTIGTLGDSIVVRTSLPFFVAVKNISLLDVIERIEALAIAQWIAIDFVSISMMFLIVLRILQEIFNIEDTKYLIKMVLMFFYVFTFYMTSTMFELQDFSLKIGMHLTIILGFVIPIFIFIIGKIRKKI